MKKITTLLFLLIASSTVFGQVFWTENFGNTCLPRANQSYTGPNGAWTITSTGTNQPYGNDFYINDRISFQGIGVCATGNDLACGTNNNCLHVGGLAISLVGIPADSASFWTGYYCQLGLCATTNRRAESPTINCTGKSNISLSFVFYEGGDYNNGDPDGDATLMYYDGSTWTKISDLVKEAAPPNRPCSGTVYGQFQAFTINLPASANNNANVKIGFNWTNNDVSHGLDPSFAVDSIQVSGSGGTVTPPTAKISASDSVGCTTLCINFTDISTNSPTSWLWTFTGSNTPTSTLQNPGLVCYPTAGTYSVKLKVSNSGGTDSVTLTNFVKVSQTPPAPTITFSHDTLYCSTDPLYSAYQWYDSLTLIPSGTHSYYVITHSGNYSVKVTSENGCFIAGSINVNYVGTQTYILDNKVNMFPNPAKNELNISGNWQATTGTLTITDILGKKVREEVVRLDNRLSVNVKNLKQGLYYLQILSDKSRWTGKFVKE